MGLRKNFQRTQDLFGPFKKYFKRSKTFVDPQKNILKIHDTQKNIQKKIHDFCGPSEKYFKKSTTYITSQKKVLKKQRLKKYRTSVRKFI